MGPRPSGTSAPPPTRQRTSGASAWPADYAPSPAARRARITQGRSVLSETTVRKEPSDRDMRRKRPAALAFLLRVATARRLARVISLLALDLVGVALAILTALLLKAAVRDHVQFTPALHETERILAFAYLITALLFARSGLYSERAQRPGLSRFALINGEHFSSYYLFYGSLVFALLYVSVLRAAYESITGAVLRATGHRRRAVLVGTGEHISDVAHALGDAPHSAIEVVGFLSPNALPANGLRSLGSLGDLEHVLSAERIDEVIIADPDFPQLEAVELVDQCNQQGVRVRLAPSTMEILIHRAEFVPGQSVPLFELGPPVFEGVDFALKRTFDIVGATLLLVLLSPLLLAIMLAVEVSSRGPVVYRSTRRGIGQRPFQCLKFRTMHTDAEELQAELESLNEATGALFKIRHDPRLTRVGRVLRRFSLDELPQLVNVLRGEMSLVGPRPLPQRDYDKLEDWHRKRYLVLPGITGLWQVSGRSELAFDDLVHLDFIYLERWSLALDWTILLKTIPAVLSRRGAY
jgi:exopolysaccharide biosynthesis polyprenyl glycosylphosphotransferase